MRIGYFFTRGRRAPFIPRNFHGVAPVRRVTPPQHCTAHYPRTRSRLISPLNAGLSGCDPRRPSHSSSSSDTKHPPSLDAAADANDSVHPPPSSRHSLSTVLSCVESADTSREKERKRRREGRERIDRIRNADHERTIGINPGRENKGAEGRRFYLHVRPRVISGFLFLRKNWPAMIFSHVNIRER